MKVVLVVPNVQHHLHQETFEPLGLLYLAAMIRNEHDVLLIDAFNRHLTLEETLQEVLDFAPDVVGLSLSMSPTVLFGRELIRRIKAMLPHCAMIAGGTHATFAAEKLAREAGITAVVLHDGEETFPELLHALEHNIPLHTVAGLVVAGPEPVITPARALCQDLDTYPFPARDLLPNSTLYGRRHILSSRGCVFRCIYCAASAMHNYRWRFRSPENVVREIAQVKEHYTARFYFADDNFTTNRRRVKQICTGIHRRGLQVQWSCLSRIEFLKDREMLEEMARAGCQEVFIGVESGSVPILQAMGRRYTAEEVQRTVRRCRQSGLDVTASFIIGHPMETEADVQRSFDLAMALETHKIAFHIFTPYVGTAAYAHPEEFGMTIFNADTESYDKNLTPVLRTRHLHEQRIMELYCESFGISLRKSRQKDWPVTPAPVEPGPQKG